MCQRFQPSAAAVLFAFLSLLCYLCSFVACRSYNNGLIFYDLQTFRPYLPPTVSVSRGRGLANFKFSDKGSIWSTFGKPCECRKNLCGCCAGIKVKQYNFDQKMCANVTFVPPKEEALLEVFLNDRPSSKYGISVRNPSPFCIPVMMGIPMAMCVQMSDIAIKGNNLNMCMDFIVRLATTDLFEMHFQCMQMGLDGFQYVDKDGMPVIPPGSKHDDATSNDADDYYDYDETDENEIGYGISEQIESKEKQTRPQQNSDTENELAAVTLQTQMQQLQNVQKYDIKNSDLLTQIQHNYQESVGVDVGTVADLMQTITTLAPIVVDDAKSETDSIAAITMATDATKAIKTQESTSTLTTRPTKISINNDDDDGNDAPLTNYNDKPSTATVGELSLATTTTVKPVSKPIAAPTKNASGEAFTKIESNVDTANAAAPSKIDDDAATSAVNKNENKASAALIGMNSSYDAIAIDFVATTVAYDDDDAAASEKAFVDAPTAATTAAVVVTSEATAINSKKIENNSMPIAMTMAIATASTEPTVAPSTTTTTPKTSATNVATSLNVDVPWQPEMPATAASHLVVSSHHKYRRFRA